MMLARNLKLWVAVTCLALSLVSPAPAPELYLDIIDMAAISRMTPQQLEQLAEGLAMEEIMRTKRSSAEALKTVAAKASSGIQSKVGLLGQASAFISSASSKSGGHDEHSGYSYEAPHEEKYDYWGLKKSILYTLFQAVKAITGGVTILKGQLIKGGGALAATLGKVISSKGDVVSNIGKKIVSSAALSHKKPHATAVYGPPHVHVEYGPPTAYGAPTAPGHYPPSSAPTGYAAHKYPASLDGRSKLNGVHAGLILLTPLGEAGPTHDHKHPTSILNTFYSAIKNKFHSTAPSYTAPHYNTLPVPQYGPPTAHTAPEYGPPAPPTAPIYGPPAPPTAPVYGPPAPQTGPAYGPPALPTGPGYDDSLDYQPPPPPHPIPAFKPMSWGAVDSYGQPAATDSYADYDPRNPEVGYEYASPKHSASATKPALTPAKIQKINANIKKITEYLSHQKRSSEEFKLADLDSYRNLLLKGKIPLMPTPVVTDNELGVLSADLLPDEPSTNTTTTTTTTTTEQPQTTEKPQTTENENRRKDVKYILRGNKIVEV